MIRRSHGFTIIEMVIVIVVIGTLTTIAVTLFTHTTTSARDKARENDTRAWASTFELYRSRYNTYPALPTADGAAGAQYLCLGPFSSTNNKCVQYTGTSSQYIDATAAPTAALLSAVPKIGSTPSDSGPAVKNKIAGLIAWLTQSTNGTTGAITITANFIDFFELDCPGGFTNVTVNSDPTLTSLFNGISGQAKACSLTKSFTFVPN